ncbi:putative mannose-6-phosphate isomerase GmuF [Aquisphaera giovannonii]|uniref:Phosphohexomutase n=1 Tax=Aquisphaera giovannonii TaxID=406548 RepID=A0A5B9VZ49_9BACT|nr:type I phosphomannose isomerase catalytic subunit [Aquisphaera giovannonii]QEH33339.1 putative mannose-6-phosphate isomerase GmuF [Aquisphaera giovannonii]
MGRTALYPLHFTPILRRLLWGGRRLGTVLGKPIGDGSDYAESWELADYKDAVSLVDEGPLAGTSLRDLIRDRPAELLGEGLRGLSQFPLLVKFIDAREDLSLQVHPDDERGKRLANDNGKTETWVILAAEPGANIYAGLKPGVDREGLAAAMEARNVAPLLHHFPARPGDCILIEAGTVHAIGAGVLLAEIQQMSDATFRLDDWGRVGPDGKPRELHISQSLESTDFGRGPVHPVTPDSSTSAAGNTRERLSRTSYFALERWRLKAPEFLGDTSRFTILMGLSGAATVSGGGQSARLELGRTLLLPAAAGPCEVIPEGEASVLSCSVP